MTDLTEFVLARIAEDEAVAKASIREPRNHSVFVNNNPSRMVEQTVVDDGVWSTGDHVMDEQRVSGAGIEIYDEGGHTTEQAAHIARHDPARVLAECEAKRTIVALHDEAQCSTGGEVPNAYDCALDYIESVLQELAVVYAGHPDFREEWRP